MSFSIWKHDHILRLDSPVEPRQQPCNTFRGDQLGYRPCIRYLLIEIRAQDPAAHLPDNLLAMIARFEQATAELPEPLIVGFRTGLRQSESRSWRMPGSW